MSQNLWATIMSFGPVTLIFYWPKKKISGQPKAALISGTTCDLLFDIKTDPDTSFLI